MSTISMRTRLAPSVRASRWGSAVGGLVAEVTGPLPATLFPSRAATDEAVVEAQGRLDRTLTAEATLCGRMQALKAAGNPEGADALTPTWTRLVATCGAANDLFLRAAAKSDALVPRAEADAAFAGHLQRAPEQLRAGAKALHRLVTPAPERMAWEDRVDQAVDELFAGIASKLGGRMAKARD